MTRASEQESLRLYDTLSGGVQEIRTIEPGVLRFYSCGPTVYSYAHIGNFRTFVTADLLVRTARAIGWAVNYVTNITDVGHLTEDDVADAGGEDRMARALSSKEGERFGNVWDLARFYADELVSDWRALNLLEPTLRPRATEHMRQQILAIRRLVKTGHAYETDLGIYFSVPSFRGYGKLSGNEAAEQLIESGREVVSDPGKRDPRDFALWKKDDKHLMQWHSPWGWGFPGWHIECSVMAMEYLGEEIDIHAGGEDLIFPHHECEIAQAESLTGKRFARYWLHTRFLQVEGRKMSKSAGNFFTVKDLIRSEEDGGRGFDPSAVRLALISGQYRKPFNFTFDTLKACSRHVQRIREARKVAGETVTSAAGSERAANGREPLADRLDALYRRALDSMLDDLNTPEAIAAGLEGVKLILGEVESASETDAESAIAWLDRMESLLGWEGAAVPAVSSDDDFGETVERLLDERTQARSRRDFARADAIREQLNEMGVEVMDAPDGPTWRRKQPA